MSISKSFDNTSYGQISVDPKTGIFSIANREVRLTRTEANIIACFINLGTNRASLKTMAELVGTKEPSFKVMLTYACNKISGIAVTEGIAADALFLSDRLLGKAQSEKLPYHFNVKLADLINANGLYFNPDLISDVRTERSMVVGKNKSTGAFYRGLDN